MCLDFISLVRTCTCIMNMFVYQCLYTKILSYYWLWLMPLMHDPIFFKIYDFLKRFIGIVKKYLFFLHKKTQHWLILFVCLFVCGLSSHSRIFHSFGDVTITGERLQFFDLCSAIMAIKQWGFFNVSHLLWHGASVNNGHLREPVTLTTISERLAVEMSLPVLTT